MQSDRVNPTLTAPLQTLMNVSNAYIKTLYQQTGDKFKIQRNRVSTNVYKSIMTMERLNCLEVAWCNSLSSTDEAVDSV